MRKPEQLFDNELIKEKVLDMIYFYNVNNHTIRTQDERIKRAILFNELLIMMKHYGFCSDSVESIYFIATKYISEGYIYVIFAEQFNSSQRRTGIKLYI